MLRSLYRNILRGISKLKNRSPVTTLNSNQPSNLALEIKKNQLDPEKHKDFLLSEIRFLVKEAFMDENTNNSVNQLRKISRGTNLIAALGEIQNNDGLSWNHLISLLVEFREQQAKESVWRQNFLNDQDVIKQGVFKGKPSALVKKKLSESRRLKAQIFSAPFRSLSSSERTKEYKKQVALSNVNASKTMRLHLKSLQLLGLIPNPFKLPYLSLLKPYLLLTQPQQAHLIPGSAKSSILKRAYDQDIVKFVLGPELEHRLNEKHFLGKIEHIVNRRGPAKIKIIATHSGAMPIHFLRTPRKRLNFMKMVGVDVKRLMRCIRKRFIWNLSEGKSHTVSETKHGEGYSVVGSRGYSFDEIMFPREYYQKLADEEALWEYILDGQSNVKGTSKDTRSVTLNQILHEWTEALEISTIMIDQELEQFFKKHKAITKDLRTQRAKVQIEANRFHERKVIKFSKLLETLKKNGVFMHSDLYNNRLPASSRFEAMLKSEGSLPMKLRRGIPTREKPGMLLGDFLLASGFKGFKMGQIFKKRHSVIKHDSYIK